VSGKHINGELEIYQSSMASIKVGLLEIQAEHVSLVRKMIEECRKPPPGNVSFISWAGYFLQSPTSREKHHNQGL